MKLRPGDPGDVWPKRIMGSIFEVRSGFVSTSKRHGRFGISRQKVDLSLYGDAGPAMQALL